MNAPTQMSEKVRLRHADALSIQDACNLSGVASRLQRLCRELIEEGCGTMEVRRNPAVILIVAKMADLCNINCDWGTGPVKEAYDLCQPQPRNDGVFLYEDKECARCGSLIHKRVMLAYKELEPINPDMPLVLCWKCAGGKS